MLPNKLFGYFYKKIKSGSKSLAIKEEYFYQKEISVRNGKKTFKKAFKYMP